MRSLMVRLEQYNGVIAAVLKHDANKPRATGTTHGQELPGLGGRVDHYHVAGSIGAFGY